jgi:RNA polymerase sigma-70 factor (ECF subfamily)
MSDDSRREATDDRALMRRIRNEDEAAFADLVKRHGGGMLGVATRMLGSRADAEDAVQRAFMKCFTAAGAYRPEWAVTTWLYRILANVCFDEIRRRRARPEVHETPPVRAGSDGTAERLDLDRALRRVPDEARALILMRYSEGLSYRELARVRGIKVNTVKSQLARGKSILRAALKEDER